MIRVNTGDILQGDCGQKYEVVGELGMWVVLSWISDDSMSGAEAKISIRELDAKISNGSWSVTKLDMKKAMAELDTVWL